MSGVPVEAKESIKRKAAAEWPGDYVMQTHVIEQQTEAYLKVEHYWTTLDFSNDVLADCRKKALGDWPDDYVMQLYTFESQVGSAQEFFDFSPEGVPEEIAQEIKVRAFSEWSGDYEMMLHTAKEQSEAWLRLNGKL